MNTHGLLFEVARQLDQWPFVAVVLCKMTLALILFWMAHFICDKFHPGWRRAVWRGAALMIVLLPLLCHELPAWEWRVPASKTAHAPTTPPASLTHSDVHPSSIPQTTAPPNRNGLPAPARDLAAWSMEEIMVFLWSIGAVLMIFRILYGKWMVHLLIKGGRHEPDLLPVHVSVQPIHILSHPALASPCVARWRHPVLLVPRHLLESQWQEDWAAILSHESAHVRNRDLFWNDLLRWIQALCWFHPLVWRMPMAHQAACEEASDAEAVEALGDTQTYLRSLARFALSIVEPGRTRTSFAMAESSNLGRRLDRLEKTPRFGRMVKWAPILTGVMSIAFLLILGPASLVAAGNRNYEKAPAARNLKIKVGPNTFAISTVVRNNGDGTLTTEDGVGHPVPVPKSGIDPTITRCASWMDEAQVFLSPGPAFYDVLELRLFNSETGQSVDNAAISYCTNGSVLLRGTTALPDKVDIWFRAHSYAAKDPVYRLPCQVDASVQMGAGTLRVLDLHPHVYQSYSVGANGHIQPLGPPSQPGSRRSLYSIIGEGLQDFGQGQICVVTKQGVKVFPDTPHFFNGRYNPVISFDCPVELSEISHFEIRPFGGRHVFYFPGVRLPVRHGSNLSATPPITTAVRGKEVDLVNDVLVPIRIRVLKGRAATGTSAGPRQCTISLAEDRGTNADKYSTLIYECDGMNLGTPVFTGVDLKGTELPLMTVGNGTATSDNAMAGYGIFDRPLGDIGALTITFKPRTPSLD